MRGLKLTRANSTLRPSTPSGWLRKVEAFITRGPPPASLLLPPWQTMRPSSMVDVPPWPVANETEVDPRSPSMVELEARNELLLWAVGGFRGSWESTLIGAYLRPRLRLVDSIQTANPAAIPATGTRSAVCAAARGLRRFAAICRALKEMARALPIPFLAICQTSARAGCISPLPRRSGGRSCRNKAQA